MPLDPGVVALTKSEYERFMQAISDLSDGGEARAIQAAARSGGSTAAPKPIDMPGFGDFFQIGPGPTITPADWSAHFSALARGEPSPLSQPMQDAIADRMARAEQFNNPSSPYWAGAAGQAMTAIDNVQDMMTALAVFGRLVLAPLGVAGRLASPAVGAILLTGDLLRAATKLGMLAVPAYAFLCAGPKAALGAGVPAVLFGRGGKGAISAAANVNIFARGARVLRSRGGRSLKPSFSEWIEIAQTSSSMFGAGVVFGAGVGWISDSSYAAAGASRGAGGKQRTPRFRDVYAAMFRDVPASLSRAELRFGRAAAGVLQHAPFFMDPTAPYTLAERVEAMAALWAAVEILEPMFTHPRLDEAIALWDDERVTPPAYSRRDTQASLELGGLRLSDEPRWPLPGRPATINGLDGMRVLAERTAAGAVELVERHDDDPLGHVLHMLVARLSERLMIHALGSRDAIRYELTPPWALWESMILNGRVINRGEPDELNERFLQSAVDRIAATGRKMLDGPTMDELARAAGVALIRLQLPDHRPPELADFDPFSRLV
jgi:hypothetical protein